MATGPHLGPGRSYVCGYGPNNLFIYLVMAIYMGSALFPRIPVSCYHQLAPGHLLYNVEVVLIDEKTYCGILRSLSLMDPDDLQLERVCKRHDPAVVTYV